MSPPAVLSLHVRDAAPQLPCPPAVTDDALDAHRLRLGHIAEALALRLGWAADRARQLRLAAPLHDVGAYGGARAELSGREQLHSQPRRGAELLGGSSLPLFALAAEIALHHRERWDGSGYPNGLRGEDIPLSGRIVAVVDCFDALTMPGSFRPARADDRALAMLAEQAGTAFDPAVVAAFLAHAPELIAVRDSVNALCPPMPR